MDFKQRVTGELSNCAAIYKSVFMDYDYLIYSGQFIREPYYILNAHEDNFVHLTGVKPLIPASDFYTLCLHGTLQENHFNLIDEHKGVNSAKGTVRRKLRAFSYLPDLFSCKLQAEEAFDKGKIKCVLGTADDKITVGFIMPQNLRPMTLLKNNCLTQSKAVDISLVLRRDKGAKKFNTVTQSDLQRFCADYPDIADLRELLMNII
jgi:hypothetical protein